MPKKIKSGGIFSDDEESGDEERLKVNKKFARHYEEKKRLEELHKAKDRGLLDDDDDSSASEEDETGKELTPALDADIMTTLAMIRAKDKRIYDPEFKPFAKTSTEEQDSGDDGKDKKKKSDPVVRYKDLVRQKALELSEGKEDSDDEDLGHREARELNLKRIAYDEEQRQRKKEFISAHKDDNESDSESSDDDDLLVKKKKSKAEKEKEDAEYNSYAKELERRAKQKKQVDESTLDTVFKEAPKNDDEKFLWDYVLGRKWVGFGQSDDEDDENDGEEDVEEDLEQVEKEEEFERKFNFRFEEQGAGKIVTHARDIGDSMRRKDDSRKRARDARKARKREEAQKRIEELKRLKNLKKQELLSRAERVVQVAGVNNSNTKSKKTKEQLMAELEDDFDPEEWDKKMAEIYNDEYYDDEDEDLDVAKLRAEVDELDEPGHDEVEEEANESSNKKRRRRRKKRGEDAEEDVLDEAELEELYDVHYEDVAGGEKMRFRYSSVPQNDFGLSAEEILNADEKDLNELISLKRIAPYREEEWRVDMKQRKRFRQKLKKKLEKFDQQASYQEDAEGSKASKKKRKKDKKRKSASSGDGEASTKRSKKEKIESDRMASYGF